MAEEAVSIVDLTLNTESGDVLTTGAGGVEVDAANTFTISDIYPNERLLIVLYENGGGAATVTFNAGDRPPALLSGLGSLAVSVPQGDCVVIALEAARFAQDDATITGSVATNNVHITPIRIPRSY